MTHGHKRRELKHLVLEAEVFRVRDNTQSLFILLLISLFYTTYETINMRISRNPRFYHRVD